jgi:hypothetical protein
MRWWGVRDLPIVKAGFDEGLSAKALTVGIGQLVVVLFVVSVGVFLLNVQRAGLPIVGCFVAGRARAGREVVGCG